MEEYERRAEEADRIRKQKIEERRRRDRERRKEQGRVREMQEEMERADEEWQAEERRIEEERRVQREWEEEKRMEAQRRRQGGKRKHSLEVVGDARKVVKKEKEPKKMKIRIALKSGARAVTATSTSPGPDTGNLPPTRGWSCCPLPSCQYEGKRLKHHFNMAHLPPVLRGNVPRPERERQGHEARRLSVLFRLANWVLGEGSTIRELYNFIQARFIWDPSSVNLAEFGGQCRRLARILGEEPPAEFSFTPLNSVGLIIHWRVLLAILMFISADHRDELRRM